VITVAVLQNGMDLQKGEPGSSNETCVTSVVEGSEVIGIEAEMVSNMTEEEDLEPRTIPVIKTEPKVGGMHVVSVTHVSYKLYLHLPDPISVCPWKQKFPSGKGFGAVFKRRNVYFVTHCL
jgi:hypothetical protein